MNLNRNWLTPLTAGAFLISAITGILMFFHLDSGFNKSVHEWLSWALVLGVVLHGLSNIKALKKSLNSGIGRAVFGVFVVGLLISFYPSTGGGKPPFISSVQALANAPLPVIANVAQVSPEEVSTRLQKAGHSVSAPTQRLSEIVGNDLGVQMRALNVIFSSPTAVDKQSF